MIEGSIWRAISFPIRMARKQIKPSGLRKPTCLMGLKTARKESYSDRHLVTAFCLSGGSSGWDHLFEGNTDKLNAVWSVPGVPVFEIFSDRSDKTTYLGGDADKHNTVWSDQKVRKAIVSSYKQNMHLVIRRLWRNVWPSSTDE